jgi:5-methylcytosine-specific restriction enzyme subunit McrC
VRIACIEGEPFSLDVPLRPLLRSAAARLSRQLRPRFKPLAEDQGEFTIHGLIGSISLGPGATIDITPKTQPGEDWLRAVLQLLAGSDRIDIAEERLSGLSPSRRDLLELLAAIYAARLERALRRDGPILTMESMKTVLPRLKGKLNVSAWSRRAVWAPHRFPLSYNSLTSENDFSRALAYAARLLYEASRSSDTRFRLASCARALQSGFSDAPPPRTTTMRQLPSQWAVYRPAWSIAKALLLRKSLLGTTGHQTGLSIVIEAWPLLERLLQRSLIAGARLGSTLGRDLSAPSRSERPLLTNPIGSANRTHHVVPDGRLIEGNRTVATFEAKYKRREADWPKREDVYQALCTAAAFHSPLAVLVYPEAFPSAFWKVQGMGNCPGKLAAVGLDVFSYRAGTGDDTRGRLCLDLLAGAESIRSGGEHERRWDGPEAEEKVVLVSDSR